MPPAMPTPRRLQDCVDLQRRVSVNANDELSAYEKQRLASIRASEAVSPHSILITELAVRQGEDLCVTTVPARRGRGAKTLIAPASLFKRTKA